MSLINDSLVVSVVMITHSHEKYIKQAIEGVFKQKTNFHIEFIIANDSSPDNSDSIISDIIKSVPPNITVSYTRHKTNIGMMPNFIWALKQAKGKYIALCEGDDYWIDSLKLQKQVAFLEANLDFAISFHAVNIKYEDNITPFYPDVNKSTKKVTTINDLLNGNYIHTPSCVFRNYFEYPDWFLNVYPGDWPLHILSATNGRIFFDSTPMAVYRVHHGGIHSTKNHFNFKSLSTVKTLSTMLRDLKFISQSKRLENMYRVGYAYHYGIIGIDENEKMKSRWERFTIMIFKGSYKMKLLAWLPLFFGNKAIHIWNKVS